jgi:hypothetical protein
MSGYRMVSVALVGQANGKNPDYACSFEREKVKLYCKPEHRFK